MGTAKIVGQGSNPTGAPTTLSPALSAIVDAQIPSLQVKAFRINSLPQCIDLPSLNLQGVSSVGQQMEFKLANIGLVDEMYLNVNFTLVLTNANASAEVIDISDDFPYNLFTNVSVSENGNNMIVSASPYALLQETLIREKLSLQYISSKLASTGTSVLRIAGLSGSFQTDSSGGSLSVSVPASSTATITGQFLIKVPFVLDKKSMLGLVPLNNSTIQILTQMKTNGSISGTYKSIFASLPSGVTLTTYNISVLPTQSYWTVPANPALYSPFILNTFRMNELTANTIATTGPGALNYTPQLQTYLLRLIGIVRDSNGKLVQNMSNFASSIQINYNATTPILNENMQTYMATQEILYGTAFGAGVFVWDGNSSMGKPNEGDQSAWIDMHNTANPSVQLNVNSGLSLPATYSMLEVTEIPAVIAR